MIRGGKLKESQVCSVVVQQCTPWLKYIGLEVSCAIKDRTAAWLTHSLKPMSFVSATPWIGDILSTFIFSNDIINRPTSSRLS